MSKIPGSAHMNFTMGGLIMMGGVAGYARKGSTMSLVAGLTIGGLLVGSGLLIAEIGPASGIDDAQYKGHLLATASSGFLALGMGQRFVSTQKFMPAGMVAALGAATCAYNYNKMTQWTPSKEE